MNALEGLWERDEWPRIKNSVETGDDVTILDGYQMIVMDEFTFNGGTLTIEGEMYINPIWDNGYRDLEGSIDTRVGATNPTWTQIGSGPFYAYAFTIGDECFITYHVPHDIVPSSDIYFHTHWTTNGTDTNTVKWQFTYSYAKGFNQEAFNTTGTTITAEEAGSGTAYQHMVTETAGVTISGLTEPDGLIIVHIERITNGGTNNTDTVYLLEADVHYLSTNLATPNKAPDFYA
jgi:hypothetical protein